MRGTPPALSRTGSDCSAWCGCSILVGRGAFSLEAVDAVTGPAIGRPKSATFRTLDLTGLDVVASVAADLAVRLGDDHDHVHAFRLPAFVDRMVARGLLGEKSGAGFYRRLKPATGGASRILTLDPAALLEDTPVPDASIDQLYREAEPARFAALEAAPPGETVAARLRRLFLGYDDVGSLLRASLGPLLLYAAEIAPDVAGSIDDVDRAMRWGFGWELGPFETWDAIGVREVLDACRPASLPGLLQDLLQAGRTAFRAGGLPPAGRGRQILVAARSAHGVVRRSPEASLVDLGDGVFAVEFHSRLNVLGGDALDMLNVGLDEAAARGTALVIGGERDPFSAGADLTLVLLEAREGNWEGIDQMIRAVQHTTQRLKAAPVPVVAAPAGLALGGGCEICLHADRIQAAAESYLGLVETGVGLIPAGGGTKEMLVRAVDWSRGGALAPHVQRVFETLALARVSSSAADASRLGFLRPADGVSPNRERLIADARRTALARAEAYQPAALRSDVRVGGADLFARLALGVHLAWRAGRATDHDVLVGRKLAWVLTGGDLPHATTVSEAYLLDLEREAFLSLCGEARTQDRIAHTLRTGKPLRN